MYTFVAESLGAFAGHDHGDSLLTTGSLSFPTLFRAIVLAIPMVTLIPTFEREECAMRRFYFIYQRPSLGW